MWVNKPILIPPHQCSTLAGERTLNSVRQNGSQEGILPNNLGNWWVKWSQETGWMAWAPIAVLSLNCVAMHFRVVSARSSSTTSSSVTPILLATVAIEEPGESSAVESVSGVHDPNQSDKCNQRFGGLADPLDGFAPALRSPTTASWVLKAATIISLVHAVWSENVSEIGFESRSMRVR